MANLGITVTYEDGNPILSTLDSEKSISFYQTRETLYSPELYNRFIKSAVNAFRHSETYSIYKSILIGLGLDRDALQSNLTNEHCTIEMHHNVLTVYDIAFIMCEHVLNTTGKICTFDLCNMLKEEHKSNRVGIVMLSLTSHDAFHDNDDYFIHPSMVYGNWVEFLYRYNRGITPSIADKLIRYINKSIYNGCTMDAGMLQLREHIKCWSTY